MRLATDVLVDQEDGDVLALGKILECCFNDARLGFWLVSNSANRPIGQSPMMEQCLMAISSAL
jgi:hypothetical protein